MKVKELVLAKCVMNKDPWNDQETGLEINSYYNVQEIHIGQSNSFVVINGKSYNSVMFEYYDKYLNEIDIYHSEYSPYFKEAEKKNTFEIENMPDIYLKIINHFGINNQQRKLQEEVFELQESITKFENGIGDIKELKEELADSYILLKQIKEYYEITDEELMIIIRAKLNRTLKRIKSGYYEKSEEV